jgi:hypothetical protein
MSSDMKRKLNERSQVGFQDDRSRLQRWSDWVDWAFRLDFENDPDSADEKSCTWSS